VERDWRALRSCKQWSLADKQLADQSHFLRQHLVPLKINIHLSANILDTAPKLVQQTQLNGYHVMKNKQELGHLEIIYIIRNVHESEI